MPGDFTDHQWQRLVEAGPQIALAVAASAGSAGQSEAELGAFLRLVDETARLGERHTARSNGCRLTRQSCLWPVDRQLGRRDTQRDQRCARSRRNPGRSRRRSRRTFHPAVALRSLTPRLRPRAKAACWESAARMSAIASAGRWPRSPTAWVEPPKRTSKCRPSGVDRCEGDRTPATDGEVGPDGQPIGPENIREGTVRGTMGGPNQTQGEGQGG